MPEKDSGEGKGMQKLPFDPREVTVVANIIDTKYVPTLVGKGPRATCQRLLGYLKNFKANLLLIGAPGTGKTVTALNLGKAYIEWLMSIDDKGKLASLGLEKVPPLYYVQLSPETTKSTLMMGKLLIGGTMMTVRGCIARAMEEGALVIIDEAGQGTQEILANFNSCLDPYGVLTDGSTLVRAKPTFRIVMCTNSSKAHAGNVPFPHATAGRLLAFDFKFPSFDEEVEIVNSIIAEPGFGMRIPLKVPDSVISYVVGVMRSIGAEYREYYPLAARNAAYAVAAINSDIAENGITAAIKANEKKDLTALVREEMNISAKTDLETFLMNIYDKIYGGTKPSSTTELVDDPRLREFLRFVCAFGSNELIDCILAAFMTRVDIDSSFYDMDSVKHKIENILLAKRPEDEKEKKGKDAN